MRKAAQSKGKLLLLNSFNSSGRLEEAFQNLPQRRSRAMLSLFVDTSICRPNHHFLHDIAPCLRLAGLSARIEPHKEKIPIFDTDHHTYFPDYRRPNVEEFKFGNLEYDRARPFFERYAGKGIFRVNRRGRTTSQPGDPGRMRHHAYHVDGEALFNDDAFKTRLKEKWGGRSLPTAILSNGTKASSALLRALTEQLALSGVKTLTCKDPTFAGLPETDGLEAVIEDSKQRLLIVVPMVISGATLANVQKKMRELDGVNCQFSYLIGLLRPSSMTKMKQLQGVYLRRRENTDESWVDPVIVEAALLPNWQEDECPWQRERRLVEDALDRGADCGWMHERADLLDRATVGGLWDESVFCVPGNARLIFNLHSLWLDDDKVGSGKSNEADLCCAVASALQYWREDVRKKDWRFNTINTVNTIDIETPANHNGYNEPRLMAAIWRALTPRELVTAARAEGDNDLAGLFEKIFHGCTDPYFSPLRRETILAFGREIARKIDPVRIQHINRCLFP